MEPQERLEPKINQLQLQGFYFTSKTGGRSSNFLLFKGGKQISAKRGPASRFVVEANTKALVSKLNSRRSEYVLI